MGCHKYTHFSTTKTLCPSISCSASDTIALRSVPRREPIQLRVTLSVQDVLVETTAMIDSGAMENFVDLSFVSRHSIPLLESQNPLDVRTVDGRTLISGPITQECKLRMATGNHTENITLRPASLGNYSIILGTPWLTQHNPSIDWRSRKITFSSDTCARSCLHVSPVVQGLPNTPPVHPNPRASARICTVNSRTLERLAKKSDDIYEINIMPLSQPTSLSAADCSPLDDPIAVIPSKYNAYLDVFSEEQASTLPAHRPGADHAIPLLEGAQPPFGPIYPLSQDELSVLSDYIKTNLENGFIRPSTSPAGAPILFVKKKDGSLRLCVDYRGLNKVTIKNRYPLPLINEMLDRLSSASVFTKLDIRNAYHRIRIHEGDEWKTAFRTRYGHFEYQVMPFGLTNAPGSFQGLINDVLREYLDQFVVVYLDDILIFSNDPTSHQEHVKLVLEKLRSAGLFAKAEKCEFDVDEVEFLGFRVGRSGVTMDSSKVTCIADWPTPATVHDIQVFLGFANFYRRFIADYSRITTPLTSLLKKNVPFNWSQAQEDAFKMLKTRFTSAPILQHYKPDVPIFLETDASDFAIAGVLNQPGKDGHLHPVAFHSRKLQAAEVNYDIYEKELLAIVDCFRVWRHYLQGTKHTVTVYTDHKNLEHFMSSKVLNRRHARWSLKLNEYDMVVTYRPGSKNPKADALSRRSDMAFKEGESDVKQPVTSLFRTDHFVLDTISVGPTDTELHKKILELSRNDSDLKRLTDFIKNPTSIPRHMRSKMRRYRIADDSNLLLFDDRICIPSNDNLKLELLRTHHDAPTAGHYGQSKTCELVARQFHWPGMRKFINRYVSNCPVCKRAKPSHQAPTGHLKPLQIPQRPWSSISMDFIVGLPSSNGYNAIWVIVDRLTKMAHFVPCKDSINAQELASAFTKDVFRLHGLPDEIISDRGSVFTSRFWQSLLKLLGIKSSMSTAFHPQTDGQTERVNAILEQYLRAYLNYQQDNWVTLLPLAEFSYNNTVQATTKRTPFEASLGFHPRFSLASSPASSSISALSENFCQELQSLHEALKSEIALAQQQQAAYYNQHRRPTPTFHEGDQVYLSSKNIRTTRPSAKLDHVRLGPFKILYPVGSHAYKLDLPSSMAVHPVFHVNLLTPRDDPSLPDIPHRSLPPPPPVEVQNEEHFEVESILDSRYYRRQLQYLVAWKGYDDPSENTWEPVSNLWNANEARADFHARYPDKPGRPSPTTSSPYNTRRSRRARS